MPANQQTPDDDHWVLIQNMSVITFISTKKEQ